MQQEIRKHLDKYDLDLRKSKDGRFMDQKVTPDVLCIIADCVINFLNTTKDVYKEFTVKDIWNFDYFNENVKVVFSKPDVKNKLSKNEYDKFIGQPLKMLSYARVLSCRKSRSNYFQVSNYQLLEYISLKEKHAYNFLVNYLLKVLNDSDLLCHFERFKVTNTKNEYKKLKQLYKDFIFNNTKIKNNNEVYRIFTKVINPYAAHHNIHGTSDGNLSENIITYSDLMYNRPNWRDKDKEKHIARNEVLEQTPKLTQALNNYQIQKAQRVIKRIYKKSEVDDEYSNGKATQVHHIFPKSDFPEIATYLENLILLTPQQHLTLAHPNNNTSIINKDYQFICLMAKFKTIKEYIINSKKNPLGLYTKKGFVTVVNTGLNQNFEENITFEFLNQQIIEIYNSA